MTKRSTNAHGTPDDRLGVDALSSFLDGELGHAAARDVRERVRVDADALARLDALRQVDESLLALAAVRPATLAAIEERARAARQERLLRDATFTTGPVIAPIQADEPPRPNASGVASGHRANPVGAPRPARPRGRRSGWFTASGFLTALCVSLVLGVQWSVPNPSHASWTMLDEIVASHLAASAVSPALSPMTEGFPALLTPAVSMFVPPAPRPERSLDGDAVIRADREVVMGVDMTVTRLDDGNGPISVYAMDWLDADPRLTSREARHPGRCRVWTAETSLCSWNEGDTTYVAVADRSASALRQDLRSLRQSARAN